MFTEKIQVKHGHACAALAAEDLGHTRFDLLSRHARGQQRQRMAQVDHVIDARAEEIVGGRAGKDRGRTPRNQPLLEIELGHLRPTITLEASVYAGPGDFSGETYWEPLDDSLACSQRFKTKAIFFPPPSDGSMGETAEESSAATSRSRKSGHPTSTVSAP